MKSNVFVLPTYPMNINPVKKVPTMLPTDQLADNIPDFFPTSSTVWMNRLNIIGYIAPRKKEGKTKSINEATTTVSHIGMFKAIRFCRCSANNGIYNMNVLATKKYIAKIDVLLTASIILPPRWWPNEVPNKIVPIIEVHV